MTTGSTVLIIDDSLTVRMDLSDAFAAAGFKPLPCSTAQEAREAWSCSPVDLIVLDVLLPDGDGIELLKELRAGSPARHAPVLLLSTEAEVKDRIRGLQTGADEFVGKPYDRGYVVSKARELVPGARGATPSRATVLVVDDNAGLAAMIERYLTGQACRVVAAHNGWQGVRMAQILLPDVIILDVMMPDMDGWEVLQALRGSPATARIPAVICSVLHNPELAASLGVAFYLVKPIRRDDLLTALHQVGIV
jgi:DNA-binding response OmpR family regulator